MESLKWGELKKYLAKEKKRRRSTVNTMFEQTKHKDMRIDEVSSHISLIKYNYAMEHAIDDIIFRMEYIEGMKEV